MVQEVEEIWSAKREDIDRVVEGLIRNEIEDEEVFVFV